MEVRIGGVPEHFNLPWRLALEEKPIPQVDCTWTDFPGGTGDMCKALRENRLHLAVVLTEGILKDIHRGNSAKILNFYVSSPLIWGIHVSSTSTVHEVSALQRRRVAISREGSGSHLMVKVLAKQMHWPEQSVELVTVGNLEGGLDALKQDMADLFLWEKFTTQSYVENGTVKRIGEIPTPWPCFVIAAIPQALEEMGDAIYTLLEKVKEKAEWVKHADEALLLLSVRYGLPVEQLAQWRAQTTWFGKTWTPGEEAAIKKQLKTFGII